MKTLSFSELVKVSRTCAKVNDSVAEYTKKVSTFEGALDLLARYHKAYLHTVTEVLGFATLKAFNAYARGLVNKGKLSPDLLVADSNGKLVPALPKRLVKTDKKYISDERASELMAEKSGRIVWDSDDNGKYINVPVKDNAGNVVYYHENKPIKKWTPENIIQLVSLHMYRIGTFTEEIEEAERLEAQKAEEARQEEEARQVQILAQMNSVTDAALVEAAKEKKAQGNGAKKSA